MSTRSTFFPSRASAAPRFTAQVVFPTPPFWFMKAIPRTENMIRDAVRPFLPPSRSRSRFFRRARARGRERGTRKGVLPISLAAPATERYLRAHGAPQEDRGRQAPVDPAPRGGVARKKGA